MYAADMTPTPVYSAQLREHETQNKLSHVTLWTCFHCKRLHNWSDTFIEAINDTEFQGAGIALKRSVTKSDATKERIENVLLCMHLMT